MQHPSVPDTFKALCCFKKMNGLYFFFIIIFLFIFYHFSANLRLIILRQRRGKIQSCYVLRLTIYSQVSIVGSYLPGGHPKAHYTVKIQHSSDNTWQGSDFQLKLHIPACQNFIKLNQINLFQVLRKKTSLILKPLIIY